MRIAIIKVSFVPDHVHLAIPTVSPAEVVVQDLLVREGLERLWEGSYGDLASSQLRKYIRSLFEDD